MTKSKEWIENSSHKPWCNKAPGNIYASEGDPCDCGLMEALMEIQQIENMMQEIRPAAMPNAEVSEGGPLTHKQPAAQSRPSLH